MYYSSNDRKITTSCEYNLVFNEIQVHKCTYIIVHFTYISFSLYLQNTCTLGELKVSYALLRCGKTCAPFMSHFIRYGNLHLIKLSLK